MSRADDVNVLMGNQFIHFTPFAMLSANELLLCENIISFDGLREIFQLISKVGHEATRNDKLVFVCLFVVVERAN